MTIVKTKKKDATCMGTALAAGLHAKVYKDFDEISHFFVADEEIVAKPELKAEYDKCYEQ